MSTDPTYEAGAFRPRRSVLYMPSSNERALAKAKALPVDALILDLEDAVAPDAKEAARESACAAVRSGEYGRRELTIRVNGIGTQWHEEDLAAACAAGPDGIVVPKVNTAKQVKRLIAQMEKAGAPDKTRLWAMVETPQAIFHVRDIARASGRLAVLVIGTNDLVKELRAEHVPGRAPLLTSLSMALLAAREAGIAILDGVYNNVRDEAGFRAECEQGPRGPGRLGGRRRKWCGHLQRQNGRKPACRHRRTGACHQCRDPINELTHTSDEGPDMDLNRRTMFAASTFVAGCLLVPGVAEGAAGGTLRRGDSGAAVRDLQTRLTKLKYYVGNIDGSFGDLTFQGVLAIQKVAGLPRDGIVATKTWAAIDGGTKPTPRSGSGRAAEVDKARQVLLVVKDGVLLHTLNTSTGSGERYFSGGSWHTLGHVQGLSADRRLAPRRAWRLVATQVLQWRNRDSRVHQRAARPRLARVLPGQHHGDEPHLEHRGAARGDRARLLTTLLTTGTVALTTGTVALTNEMSRQRQGRRRRPLRLARIPSARTTLPCCGRPGAETRTPAGCR